MSYRVELARSADRELWRLPEPYRTKVFKLIKMLGEEPRPQGCKKLKGTTDAWRVAPRRKARSGFCVTQHDGAGYLEEDLKNDSYSR